MAQKIQVDRALLTAELILRNIEALEQTGANKVVTDTTSKVGDTLAS